MKPLATMILLSTLIPASALAEQTRQLGAHEHGSGALNIAIEGDRLNMIFEAPGADIVGFEHAAKTAADRETTEAAISDLAKPLDLFVLPAEAGCAVTSANVSIIGGPDDKAADAHDHADDAHEHEHEHEHEEGHSASHAAHNEFRGEYALTCADPSAIENIELAYFERFPNALELSVQVVSDAGARAFEVKRENPLLALRGMF